MCRGGGGAKVFDLFSKPGPRTHSHGQQTVQTVTSFFMGLGTTIVQTIPQRSHPQGERLLDRHGPAWQKTVLELELCRQGQLLPRGLEKPRISPKWRSAGADIPLGTEQIGNLDISSICLASAAGGLVLSQL